MDVAYIPFFYLFIFFSLNSLLFNSIFIDVLETPYGCYHLWRKSTQITVLAYASWGVQVSLKEAEHT